MIRCDCCNIAITLIDLGFLPDFLPRFPGEIHLQSGIPCWLLTCA